MRPSHVNGANMPKANAKPAHIEVIARGVLVNRSGQVLLCVNRKHGYAYLPGGHVEFGEAAADAAVREFAEETGLTVRASAAIAFGEERFTAGGSDHHEVNVVFHVEHLTKGRRTPPPPVVESLEPKLEFRWVSRAELSKLDLRPGTIKNWLASWMKDQGPMSWLTAK